MQIQKQLRNAALSVAASAMLFNPYKTEAKKLPDLRVHSTAELSCEPNVMKNPKGKIVEEQIDLMISQLPNMNGKLISDDYVRGIFVFSVSEGKGNVQDHENNATYNVDNKLNIYTCLVPDASLCSLEPIRTYWVYSKDKDLVFLPIGWQTNAERPDALLLKLKESSKISIGVGKLPE
ncbi:MAG: hypothetical protein ABR981_00900 [Candidatus Micrarchaeaceae archaeon]|jgi:hypothetical protein